MSTKRAAPVGQARGRSSKTSVTERGAPPLTTTNASLDALEEKVVRMRRGLQASDDMELEQVGNAHPSTRAKLREIELRAFEKSGRLERLRREAGLPEASSGTKQKIISRLEEKRGSDAKKVKASSTRPASARSSSTPVKRSAATSKSSSRPKAKRR